MSVGARERLVEPWRRRTSRAQRSVILIGRGRGLGHLDVELRRVARGGRRGLLVVAAAGRRARRWRAGGRAGRRDVAYRYYARRRRPVTRLRQTSRMTPDDVLRALRGGPATLDALHARLGGPRATRWPGRSTTPSRAAGCTRRPGRTADPTGSAARPPRPSSRSRPEAGRRRAEHARHRQPREQRHADRRADAPDADRVEPLDLDVGQPGREAEARERRGTPSRCAAPRRRGRARRGSPT